MNDFVKDEFRPLDGGGKHFVNQSADGQNGLGTQQIIKMFNEKMWQ